MLGSDVAGEVVEVGPEVSRFKPGDRVLGHAVGADKTRNTSAESAFQTYTVLLAHMASPIPDGMAFERAAVLPLALSTAACGLFEPDQLALQRPSPKNFGYVETLGAARAFDYRSPSVVADVIEAFEGRTIAGALAIGAGSSKACLDIVGACRGRRFVAMATPPVSFDKVPTGGGRALAMAPLIARMLAANASMTLKSRVHRIRTKFIAGSSLLANDVGPAIYVDFLPQALASGAYVAAPDPLVVGHGLDQIPAALDAQKQGVSARKIVVTL